MDAGTASRADPSSPFWFFGRIRRAILAGGGDRVAEDADPFDLDLGDVAGLHG